VTYSLTYNMQTGKGRRSSASADTALHDHAALLVAHANRIVVRDAQNRVVSISDLVARKTLDARSTYQNDGNSD
jgi:hypothetical protein